MATKLRPLELLAPARNAAIAIEAIRHGADAVYIGGPSHGARAAAGNTLQDIAAVVDYAHAFRARVYVTLNTLIYESELTAVQQLVTELYKIGVDALIVQDMALLSLKLPPIALHASTQCDIRSPQKAQFLAQAGFSQLVLPREMSLDEIAQVHAAVPDTPLEAFCHGALCVCYSGDCQASLLTTGRSANRGECAQICRLPFDLIDGDGRAVIKGKHLLSLRDMDRRADLAAMAAAGISSFKIEGRLKEMTYVKETVGEYRRLLDDVIEANSDLYCRASCGVVAHGFVPDASRAFFRGGTSYFLREMQPGPGALATFDTPKSIGLPVATVSVGAVGTRVVVRMDQGINNGDGLGYFDGSGAFCGFRVNRVEGSTLHTATPVSIPKGTTLYRNKDVARERLLQGDTASRSIEVDVTLRAAAGMAVIDLADDRGLNVSVSAVADIQPAKTPQSARHEQILTKTGGTVYSVRAIEDRIPDRFIAASVLTDLRRRAFELLDAAAAASYPYDYRRPDRAGDYPLSRLTYHDNVANSEARAFYRRHGAEVNEPAAEVQRPSGSVRVMTTRYCLRRELGACLKESGGKNIKGPLLLRSGNKCFNLSFDCSRCRMHLTL